METAAPAGGCGRPAESAAGLRPVAPPFPPPSHNRLGKPPAFGGSVGFPQSLGKPPAFGGSVGFPQFPQPRRRR